MIKQFTFSSRFAFIEFLTPEEAQQALVNTNRYSLDKKHTLLVNRWSDVNRLQRVPDVYEPPVFDPFVPKVLIENSQFSFYFLDSELKILIFGFFPKGKSSMVVDRPLWTRSICCVP